MTELQVFRYKDQQVRTIERDGEVWFIAKDVCDILDIRNTSDAIKSLDDDEKMTLDFSEGHSGQRGGAQSYNGINEAGMYKLIFNSRKPEAKEFTRWVTHEVLPSIRKTGSYSVFNPALPSGVLDGAKLIFETAGIKDNQLTLALDKVYRSYTGRSALQSGEIALTAPSMKQILTPTEIGSHFGLKAQRVNEILAGAGYQHKINGKWEALPLGRPYAIMQDTGKRHTNGTPVRQLKWDSDILEVFPQLSA